MSTANVETSAEVVEEVVSSTQENESESQGTDRFGKKNEEKTDGDTNELEQERSFRAPQKFEASRFSRPKMVEEKASLRLVINENLVLSRYGGSSKKRLIRPGGIKLKPKRFIAKSQRVSRKKKLGIRVSYSLKDLLLAKPLHRQFPINCEMIQDVFEEGLGIDDQELDRLVTVSSTSVTTKKSKSKSRKQKGKSSKSQKDSMSLDDTIDEKKKDDLSGMKDTSLSSASTSVTTSGAGSASGSKDVSSKGVTDTGVITTTSGATGGGADTSGAAAVAAAPKKRWNPRQLSPQQKFRNSISFLLNKVTMSNFSTIKRQLIEKFVNDVKQVEQLKTLVSLIFDKTVTGPMYGPLYAQLCVELSKKNKRFEETNGDQVEFKTALVQQCQVEFSKGHVPPVLDANTSAEDRRLAETKQKNILMGTMKFIGQLYNCDLLRSNIITYCLKELLHAKGTPIDVEAACTLLDTVGVKIDSENLNTMSSYYRKLQTISNNQRFNARVRILVKNLLEYRKKGWKSDARVPTQIETNFDESNVDNDMSGSMTDAIDEEEATANYIRMASLTDGEVGVVGLSALGLHETHQYHQRQAQSQQHQQLYQQTRAHMAGGASSQHGRGARGHGVSGGGGDSSMGVKSHGTGRHRYLGSQSSHHQRQQQRSQRGQQQQQRGQAHGQMSQLSQQGQSQVTTQGASQQRFLMKSRRIESRTLAAPSESTYAEAAPIEEEQVEEKVDVNDNVQSGEELSDSKREELFDKYLTAKFTSEEFASKIRPYSVDKNKLVSESWRTVLDRNEQQQERFGTLLVELNRKGILSYDNIKDSICEFFEFYTSEIADVPKLAQESSNVLSVLIVENVLSMKDIGDFVSSDPTMMKKPYDKRNEEAKDLTYAHSFLAHLLKAIKEQGFSNDRYVQELLQKQENEFDLNNYFNTDEIKQLWTDHWHMGWLNQ